MRQLTPETAADFEVLPDAEIPDGVPRIPFPTEQGARSALLYSGKGGPYPWAVNLEADGFTGGWSIVEKVQAT